MYKLNIIHLQNKYINSLWILNSDNKGSLEILFFIKMHFCINRCLWLWTGLLYLGCHRNWVICVGQRKQSDCHRQHWTHLRPHHRQCSRCSTYSYIVPCQKAGHMLQILNKINCILYAFDLWNQFFSSFIIWLRKSYFNLWFMVCDIPMIVKIAK